MTKPNLCVGFVDTFGLPPGFFTEWLSEEFNVIRNDVKPDYLFFGDETFGTQNLQYNDCIKIFYTGENRRFWDYKCHHAITFDHIDIPQHYRLPLYVMNIWEYTKKHKWIIPEPTLETNLRTYFCGFVNSNPHCAERNTFFQELSQYRKVDSAGPLFNNTGYVLPREDGHIHKRNFLNDRKFTIAFENSSYAGYVSEKILEAYYAGSIPLYWGSPTVELDFNPDAIVNWHNFLDNGAMIEYIKQLDTSDDMYQEMRSQPLFTNNTPNMYTSQDRFLSWFRKSVYKGSRV